MLKETVRSLKLYFGLCGIVGIIPVFGQIATNRGNPIVVLFAIISLLFALTYLYVGFSLQRLIVTSSDLVIKVLYANAAYSIFCFLISLLAGFNGVTATLFAFGLLILYYLAINVKRLALKEQGESNQEGLSR